MHISARVHTNARPLQSQSLSRIDSLAFAFIDPASPTHCHVNAKISQSGMNVGRTRSRVDLDFRESRDHGESSSARTINAISTKCSLSLVNEAERKERTEREEGTRMNGDHCFLIT